MNIALEFFSTVTGRMETVRQALLEPFLQEQKVRFTSQQFGV